MSELVGTEFVYFLTSFLVTPVSIRFWHFRYSTCSLCLAFRIFTLYIAFQLGLVQCTDLENFGSNMGLGSTLLSFVESKSESQVMAATAGFSSSQKTKNGGKGGR